MGTKSECMYWPETWEEYENKYGKNAKTEEFTESFNGEEYVKNTDNYSKSSTQCKWNFRSTVCRLVLAVLCLSVLGIIVIVLNYISEIRVSGLQVFQVILWLFVVSIFLLHLVAIGIVVYRVIRNRKHIYIKA